MNPIEPFSGKYPPYSTTHDEIWVAVSSYLKISLGNSTFDLWFSDFKLIDASKETITLLAPGTIYAIWVTENFENQLRTAFESYLGEAKTIHIVVEPNDIINTPNISTSQIEHSEDKPVKLSEEVNESELIERGRAAGLSELYNFENFVSGSNNKLALAAARAVTNYPGNSYQLLAFHSICGLGKTHLLHSIGWESLHQRPYSKIILVTAEQFANDYIDSIQKQSLAAFHDRYREVDLLLIDDVQFLGRSEGMQREFFQTFNRLIERRKQIVLASDCPASEIGHLEERLVSRFQGGVGVEINRPDIETRAAILRRKRDDWKMQVSNEIIDHIAENVSSNVRALEGALIRVSMLLAMQNSPVTEEQISDLISDCREPEEIRPFGVQEIKEVVAEHYNLEVKSIDGRRRTAHLAEARQISMFLTRKLTDLSLVEVAAAFGRDHSTVTLATKVVKHLFESSTDFAMQLESIVGELICTTPSKPETNANALRRKIFEKSAARELETGFPSRSTKRVVSRLLLEKDPFGLQTKPNQVSGSRHKLTSPISTPKHDKRKSPEISFGRDPRSTKPRVRAGLRNRALEPLSEIVNSVDTPEGRRRVFSYLQTCPFPHYEPCPVTPQLLIRIEKDGTKKRGHFVNRDFVDAI